MGMTVQEFFAAPSLTREQIKAFSSTEGQLNSAKLQPIGYGIPQTKWEKIARVISCIVSIIIFPIGLYSLLRMLAGSIAYPVSALDDADYLDGVRVAAGKIFKKNEFVFKRTTLEIEGYKYDCFFAGSYETIKNRKWVLRAPGNNSTAEQIFRDYGIQINEGKKPLGDYNIVMVNGPGVGSSQGSPLPEQMGNAQRIALLFLEKIVKTEKMLVDASSLGGGATARAFNDHNFEEKVDYAVITNKSFKTLADAAGGYTGAIFPHILSPLIIFIFRYILKMDIDCVKAAKKLASKKISQVVVQSVTEAPPLGTTDYILDIKTAKASPDGVISAEASLLTGLQDQKIFSEKTLMGYDYMNHGSNGQPQDFMQKVFDRAFAHLSKK